MVVKKLFQKIRNKHGLEKRQQAEQVSIHDATVLSSSSVSSFEENDDFVPPSAVSTSISKNDLLEPNREASCDENILHVTITLPMVQEIQQWQRTQPHINEDKITIQHVLPVMKQLANLCKQVRNELYHGSGMVRMSCEQEVKDDSTLRRLYLAVGVLLGQPLSNNAYGRLYTVQDKGGNYRHQAIPISQTKQATGLHTDSSSHNVLPDLVGLLCLRPDARGEGQSRLSSAQRAHELMKRCHPELVRVLEQDHYRDIVTPGSGEPTRQERLQNSFPIFTSDANGNFQSIRYMRYWIEQGYKKLQGRVPSQLLQAMTVLDQVLNSDDQAMVATFTLQQGEQLWVNNQTILHDRTAYQDSRRLLLRQWVSRATSPTTKTNTSRKRTNLKPSSPANDIWC
mmetsp:Transcript_10855/g.16686  ORF Transcript_10855/g.16686 Transcript_10855/m.16686 type:complete len:397 (+) Transcript_10855:26-1216(+)